MNLLLEVVGGTGYNFVHALEELFIVVDPGEKYCIALHLDKDPKNVSITQRGERHQIGRAKPSYACSTLLPAVLKFHVDRPVGSPRFS